MLSIKNIFFLVFSLSVFSSSFAQNIDSIANKFWEALDLNNHKAIVENCAGLGECDDDIIKFHETINNENCPFQPQPTTAFDATCNNLQQQ